MRPDGATQVTRDGESRRREALRLSEELLSDIELSRIPPVDVARKTGRLARLLDDADAAAWLRYETNGYPKPLDAAATAAAARSNRYAEEKEGRPTYWAGSLGQLQLEIDAVMAQIASVTSAGTSHSEWAATVEREKAARVGELRSYAGQMKAVADAVVGALHDYVASRHQELRFGSSVETAFEVVREEVDAAIARLVPDALPMLTAAFENASSANPEHWSNAASTCRRLLKEAADALRPPGPDVVHEDGGTIRMSDQHYVNRLVDWIVHQAESETAVVMIAAELEFLGPRLDAADKAGQKGAHGHVSRLDASRYITGTYLVLGDILRLQTSGPT